MVHQTVKVCCYVVDILLSKYCLLQITMFLFCIGVSSSMIFLPSFHFFCFSAFLKGKYQQNLKVSLKFVVDCHPSVLRLSMSVSGHRWTEFRVDCNLKKVRRTVFKMSKFCSQNAPEQVMSCSY